MIFFNLSLLQNYCGPVLLRCHSLGSSTYVRVRLASWLACALHNRLLMTFCKSLKLYLFFMMICFCATSSFAESYAVAKIAAPVLNSPEFGKVFGGRDGKTLKTDSCGQVREMEFIALPGTAFKIVGKSGSGQNTVYRVVTADYPAATGVSLYVDSRFLELRNDSPPPRKRALPSKQEIVSRMKAASGLSYVWGGNIRQGVSELFNFYYQEKFQGKDEKHLILAGLDCSGLLYETTNGWTPRNTSALIRFGDGVSVAGKSLKQITELLEPLDLIVWNGHVLIVLDKQTIIESRLECGKPGNGGVVISSLQQRLSSIIKTRQPVNEWPVGGKKKDLFVVRRWYPT